MSYFLKKAKQNNRTFLSIYECYYDKQKKMPANKCYMSLGSVETHIKNGLKDPMAHFQKEVDKLNAEVKELRAEKISKKSPLVYLGYFPYANILSHIKIKKYFDLFKLVTNFKFDLFDLISSLVYARAVCPCSKIKTFHDVLPSLYEHYDYSYDQMLYYFSFSL
jgi:hypothetical protein